MFIGGPFCFCWLLLLQDTILDFIHRSYHDNSGALIVPEHLRMPRDTSKGRLGNELKVYRSKNRYDFLRIQEKDVSFLDTHLWQLISLCRIFLSKDDCSPVLDWIRRTQA